MVEELHAQEEEPSAARAFERFLFGDNWYPFIMKRKGKVDF